MACRAPPFLAIGMTNTTKVVLVSKCVLSTLIILLRYSHQCRYVQLNMKDISQRVGSTEWTLNGRERQRQVQGDCFLDHWGPCELLSKTQLTEIKPVTAYCSIQRHNCVQSAGERGTGRGACGRLRRTREGGEPLLPATDLFFSLVVSVLSPADWSRCFIAIWRQRAFRQREASVNPFDRGCTFLSQMVDRPSLDNANPHTPPQHSGELLYMWALPFIVCQFWHVLQMLEIKKRP